MFAFIFFVCVMDLFLKYCLCTLIMLVHTQGTSKDAIITRSAREMSQTIRIDGQLASQFDIAFCLYTKNSQNLSRRPTLAHVAVE